MGPIKTSLQKFIIPMMISFSLLHFTLVVFSLTFWFLNSCDGMISLPHFFCLAMRFLRISFNFFLFFPLFLATMVDSRGGENMVVVCLLLSFTKASNLIPLFTVSQCLPYILKLANRLLCV